MDDESPKSRVDFILLLELASEQERYGKEKCNNQGEQDVWLGAAHRRMFDQ